MAPLSTPTAHNENTAIELLAPAGDMTCLHAAVRAGANAVYVGLDKFNARRNATNFTLETLKEACDYAHLRQVRIYVALNVEILPTELKEALDYARQIYESGADALILQDVGLIAEIRRSVPSLALHLSTQMNIHNAAGIELAAILGAERVTLARELSLQEIAELSALASDLGLEVECFAHGALCVCYSGQCLMSSLIGSRSANRGLCAQACRLPYELYVEGHDDALPAPGEHLLSPKDLCSIDLLDSLQAAGVHSLKIEGRMKSADYVYEVVSIYREVLDKMRTDTAAADADAVDTAAVSAERRARLAEVFSRGFTTAYLEGQRNNDIMSFTRPNNRGILVGRVLEMSKQVALIKSELDLHTGDLLEFWTNRGHFTAEVKSTVHKGENALIDVDQPTGKGDRVFRVHNSQTTFVDDPFEPRIPLHGTLELLCGKPATLTLCAEGCCVTQTGDIVEKARTKEVSASDAYEHIDRLGQTPFMLENLDITIDPGIGMRFSALHHLRAEALDMLQANLLATYRSKLEKQKRPALSFEDFLPAIHHEPSQKQAEPFVTAWVTNPSCARAARKADAQRLYVPILNFRRGESQIAGVRTNSVEQAGYPKDCIMALPTIDHDPAVGTREAALDYALWDYVKSGKIVFADNLADVWRARLQGAQVEVGPHVPIMNKAALELLAQMGCTRVWLSPELTLGQIADLAENAPLPLGLFVSGAQELMITEHCVLMSQGRCNEDCSHCRRRFQQHHLLDRKDYAFPVITDALGRSHIYNGVSLDALASLKDLIDIGIDGFMVDTTLLDKEETAKAVRRAVRARDAAVTNGRSVEKNKGTTTGHLFRGVL